MLQNDVIPLDLVGIKESKVYLFFIQFIMIMIP